MKPLIWKKETIKPKLEKIVEVFESHINYYSPIWKRSEDAYRSNFYRKYANEVLNNSRLELSDEYREWLVEAEMNHSFSFVRLLHSTLISNEPVVTASPANDSQEARDSSSAAETLIKYGKDEYKVKDNIDSFILRTFIYGLGLIRVDWNANLGEIIDYDKKGEELTFEGNNEIRIVEPRNFCLFSTSNNLHDSYGYLERLWVDVEEAKAMWPKYADKFITREQDVSDVYSDEATDRKTEKVVVYEYIEKGRPLNANLGRHVLFLEDYTVLELEDNPHDHKELPIAYLADIVVPNRLFPMSLMEILNAPQKQINELMSRVLENVKLFTKIFVLVDRNANLNENALTDLPTIPVTYTSVEGRPPQPMPAPQLPSFVFETYTHLVQMMQQLAGIRDFSRGVMAKAVSGFAANLMIEADNKVQIQLHERYKMAVKRIFELLLSDMQQYWGEARTIRIINEEDEVEERAFSGSDLQGGYVITTDFGSSLPIDPAARRQMVQEIGTLAQQWGIKIDGNKFFELLRLGDVMGTFNTSEAAAKVQRKERQDMIKSAQPIDIDYYAEDHLAHYIEMFGFFQTNEYSMLPEPLQQILKEHANRHLMADVFMKQGATEEQFLSGQLPAPQAPQGQEQSGVEIPGSPTETQEAGNIPQPIG